MRFSETNCEAKKENVKEDYDLSNDPWTKIATEPFAIAAIIEAAAALVEDENSTITWREDHLTLKNWKPFFRVGKFSASYIPKSVKNWLLEFIYIGSQ